MDISKVNIEEKFKLFNEYWTPKLVGELNGQYVKLAKLKGEFVWHSHEHEDEMFMIIKGRLLMEMRDGSQEVGLGEFIIVPKGVEHNPKTVDNQEVWLMLFEPKETMHTGEVEHEKTVHDQQWI